VAQYIDGDAEDPIRTECVDLYIEDALPKHRVYLHRRDEVTPHHDRYNSLHQIVTIAPTQLKIATPCSPLLIAPPNKALPACLPQAKPVAEVREVKLVI
jgi:hypothetical protein